MKMTGEFSTSAHWIAGADADRRLAGHARGRLGHEAGRGFMMRRDHRPAALLGFEKHVDEVRIGNAEQRVDTLGFEEVEDAFVDFDGHA
jgi:hypothetical protein